ncbi:hypothetical protein ABER99_21370 [Paenibacillus glucanolyticus]|jgi:hypothetical protein|uniref:Uncharacterized protein n=1 Tax=Paenibacillus glucanolyticus TaxID=59843 RepID=A0A163G620_9BACL|nr:hypothetical protein [Paenibacillus glucanolyticus]KZS44752.1 hypothetical protein AWU65_01815 [Paenibacillus glucanolyticus]OMF65526.1 hypothetical protein BK142_30735 [Paenibacillus glucanolyticus]
MEFNCSNGKTTWQGKIKNYKEYGNHYSLDISARGSGISLYFGQASFGQWFICIPDWNAGLIIGDLRQVSYNAEKIGVAMENDYDGHSVAKALFVFAETKKIQEKDATQEYLDILKAAGFKNIDEG